MKEQAENRETTAQARRRRFKRMLIVLAILEALVLGPLLVWMLMRGR
jgi:uncharacterized Tic20 family protein